MDRARNGALKDANTMDYVQFGQIPFSYATGLRISNNTTTPNTKLNVAVGSILDSTKTYQMLLSTAVVIDTAAVGLVNGLDTGVLLASTVYSVFLIAGNGPTGCLVSLSPTAPLLPSGYNIFALIGYMPTDSIARIQLGIWGAGNTGERNFLYNTNQPTSVVAGSETVLTPIDLSTLVPYTETARYVYVSTSFTPSVAGRGLNIHPTGSTGSAFVSLGQVVAVALASRGWVYARNSGGVPSISYQVTNAADVANIKISGFMFTI